MGNAIRKLPFGLSVMLGIFSCILLIALVASLGPITKWVGHIFLWIPSQLGLVRTVTPSEVIVVDFSINPTTVTFPRAGAYNLYTNFLDLLELADTVDETRQPWLVIEPVEEGADPAQVLFITRGLAPFDTPYAEGRPIFYILVQQPGAYSIRHPTRPTMVYFVPDYTTGHEQTLVAIYGLELLLIFLPLWSYFRRRWKARAQAIRSEREQNRARADAFWEEYRAKQKQKPDQWGRKKRW